MIFLKSSDGEIFEVEEAVALKSQTIKQIIEDNYVETSNPLPLSNVTSTILAKVIEYCKRHVEAKADAVGASALDNNFVDEDLKRFDAEFVNVDHTTLFDLIVAADSLKIKSLLDIACQAVADMIEGKTPMEIRKIFNIDSPKVEEGLRKDDARPSVEALGLLLSKL